MNIKRHALIILALTMPFAVSCGQGPSTSVAQSIPGDSPDQLNNVAVTAVANIPNSGDLTISLVGANGEPVSASNASRVAFKRESHSAVGYETVVITSPLSVVVPSGAALGFAAEEVAGIYPTLTYDGDEVQLAVTGRVPFIDQLASVIAISAGSDNHGVMYGPNAKIDVAIRNVGVVLLQSGTPAGTWANAPLDLAVGPWWQSVRPARGSDVATGDTRLLITAGSPKDSGASGMFTTADSKTVTVVNGLITSITE